MPDILLATLNARYIHAAFGLRYLLANLRSFFDRRLKLEDVVALAPDILAAVKTPSPADMMPRASRVRQRGDLLPRRRCVGQRNAQAALQMNPL